MRRPLRICRHDNQQINGPIKNINSLIKDLHSVFSTSTSPASFHLYNVPEDKSYDKIKYLSIIMPIMYAVRLSRPDVLHATAYANFNTINRVLIISHLKNTISMNTIFMMKHVYITLNMN